jgi:putative peptide zinc metalloprotease protein
MSAALAEAPREETPAAGFSFRPDTGLPALRRDLQITQVSYRRRRSWVVKDPVSLRYYRWGEWDYRVAKLLDGKRRIEEIASDLSRAFDREVDSDQVMATVNNLLSTGLLRNTGTVARRLHESRNEMVRKKKKKTRFLVLASKVISFKITLFDPDLLLMRMSKKLAFLWTPGAVAVLAAMLAASAWLMLANQASLAERMPDLLGWENLTIFWLVMVAVKIVHEFGHGLACKHYGGEVHEMGAMFILLSPFLFCNASDSWTFREKNKRLVVNFSGIYLELFLAAVAAALWVLTQPGIFNQICFNVMLVCSVLTIFFNANPLMKFDGYYALSDWMEIPNLKERGDRALISGVAGLLTGGQGINPDPMVSTLRGRIMFYAVASYLWIFIVAYNMLQAIGGMLEPYGLDRLAQGAASLALLTGVVAPPIMVTLHVRKVLANNSDHQLRRTIIKRGLLGAILLAVVLAVPWPVNVRSACVIDAVNRVRITAATAGYVREVKCSDGHRVAAGDVLAELANPDLERQVRDYELRFAALQAAMAAAEADPEFHSNASGLRLQAAQLETALRQTRLEHERLTLTSPIAGVVSGRGLGEKNGALLKRGELFCEILPEGPAEAVVVLGETEAGEVEPGQSVVFRLKSLGSRTFEGKVLEVTEQPLARLPHQSLGQHAGGTVPSVMAPAPPGSADPSATEALPSGQVFATRVAITDDEGLLRPGMAGRVKISCGRKPLGALLWQKFTSMLRTDFRL